MERIDQVQRAKRVQRMSQRDQRDQRDRAAAAARETRLGVALWTRLARAYLRNLRLAEARLRAWDLSVAQFDVLAQVGAHEGLSQQELAQRLLVTQGAITQLLDRLEQRGLLRRCPDGRRKRLALTEEGRRLHDRVVPEQEAFQVEQFAALTRDEQHQLLALLRKLRRAADEDEPERTRRRQATPSQE